MAWRTAIKFRWILFAISFLIFILVCQSLGKAIYINRTESMPRGLYSKITKSEYDIGDIIIFDITDYKNTLIKYIVAKHPGEYCLHPDGSFWVDGAATAQLNISKHVQELPKKPSCQSLKPDEFLVLGDHPDSYDSRYFGTIKIDQITAQVELLWEF